MTIDMPLLTQLPSLRKLWKEAFGDTDEFLDTFEKTAFSPKRCRCVTVDGEVASALYWFDCSCEGRQIAYLYAIATAKAYRGLGMCRRLMENTHSHLKSLGFEGAILVPSSRELFEFYGLMGYKICSYISQTCTESCDAPVDFQNIGKQEYARKRRELLPDGSVIQEGENLDFLQAQANFYAGEDFLMAARGEGDTLYAQELLGNKDAAAQVAWALGYSRVSYRGVGDGRAFAMYCSLGDSRLPPPAYFGLAFD